MIPGRKTDCILNHPFVIFTENGKSGKPAETGLFLRNGLLIYHKVRQKYCQLPDIVKFVTTVANMPSLGKNNPETQEERIDGGGSRLAGEMTARLYLGQG